jgi:acyl-CoA synthetase (AMP-forming)/AMP-acid ligase II
VQADILIRVLDPGGAQDVALISPDRHEEMTYARLRDNVDSFSRALYSQGVRRGDRVAFVLPNGVEFIQCVLGITHLGAAACPLNPEYTRAEFAFFFQDLAPQIVLLPKGRYPAARGAYSGGMRIIDVQAGGRTGLEMSSQDSGAATGEPQEGAAIDDIALLLHTSGTTSRPKQVPLLHRNLVASVRAILSHYQLSGADVSYCSMPLFHVHGLVACVLAALASGGTVVLPKRPSASTFWASLEKDHVTWFSAAPSLHLMLLDKRSRNQPARTRSAIRFVRSSSSPLSHSLFSRLEQEFAAPMLQAYGMTEASHQIASNPMPPSLRSADSVGVPTGTEIVILDDDGRALPNGEVGEVAIRGPNVTPGYLDNPEANTQAFSDGWFRTGDQGAFDAGGYLRLRGRIKELIIRGGENISPYEVEDVLRSHSAVADVVCFPVPDRKYGESVGAAVVLATDVDKDELLRHCAESLTASKIPQVLGFVDQIPRTSTGKPQRRAAAALIGQGAQN